MLRHSRALCTGLLAVLLAGCDGSPSGPEGAGNITIRLSQTSAAATSLVSASLASLGNVTLSDVASITATLTRVEALPANGDEESDGGWVTIPLETDLELDLLDLPTSEANALVLPTGDLAAGTYHNLRLYVSDATITFANDVTIGLTTWAAGEPHPLRIPGPADTRILVPTASFTIAEGAGATIDVIFNAGTSIGSIVATPGFVLMTPVLVARVEDAEEPEE